MKKITLCTCKLPYYSPGSHLLFQIEESPMRASIFLRESWWAKRKSPPFLYFRENLRENKIVMYWCVLFIYLLTISPDWIIIKLFFNIFFFGRQLIYHSLCSTFFSFFENLVIIFYHQVILQLNVWFQTKFQLLLCHHHCWKHWLRSWKSLRLRLLERQHDAWGSIFVWWLVTRANLLFDFLLPIVSPAMSKSYCDIQL